MASYAGKTVAALKIEARRDGQTHMTRERALFTPTHAFNLLYAWPQITVSQTVIPVVAGGEELYQGWLRKIRDPRNPPAANEAYSCAALKSL
ncbi:hypothetical protein [Parerythrobacter lacustris]|uniref:Uncharacterized protein n=1 Tax=Parerythrobacter lacustris TaxID=2969984 RepID=A0ABT1XRP5_9SPHN|nr:hypothetical protein [Parerythrobacter lacustris]MCR2834339.1 hypothetical protein [Parerythrobacter lacustris]